MKELWGLRTRDYTPVTDKEDEERQKEEMYLDYIASGGADQFLQFIQRELIPIVAFKYRTDTSNQTLVGHSLGGLFALHTLFHEPDMFQGYVVASPPLLFGDNCIFSAENDYAQKQSDLPAKLYLSVGQKEQGTESRMVSNLFRFSAILDSRDYDRLTMKNQVFDNLGHCEALAPGFQSGLKWIFS